MLQQHHVLGRASFVELNAKEIEALEEGEEFVTLIRPAGTNICFFGDKENVYLVRKNQECRTRYALKSISALCYGGKWRILMSRLNFS